MGKIDQKSILSDVTGRCFKFWPPSAPCPILQQLISDAKDQNIQGALSRWCIAWNRMHRNTMNERTPNFKGQPSQPKWTISVGKLPIKM